MTPKNASRRRTADARTSEELDREAEITPRDEIAADVSAKRHGSAMFNALLDAKVMDEPPAEEPPR